MMSVSLSLTFLSWINEMSSGPCGLLPWAWSGAPSPPRDLCPHQGQCSLLGLLQSPADSFPVFSSWSHLCARRHFLMWWTVVTLSMRLPASISLTSLTLCLYIIFPLFPFLPVWVLPPFHDLYSNPTFSLKPSLIIQARVFFLPRTLITAQFV